MSGLNFYLPNTLPQDSRSILNSLAQQNKIQNYKCEFQQSGPPHALTFTCAVNCDVDKQTYYGFATGLSKKEAEAKACEELLGHLKSLSDRKLTSNVTHSTPLIPESVQSLYYERSVQLQKDLEAAQQIVKTCREEVLKYKRQNDETQAHLDNLQKNYDILVRDNERLTNYVVSLETQVSNFKNVLLYIKNIGTSFTDAVNKALESKLHAQMFEPEAQMFKALGFGGVQEEINSKIDHIEETLKDELAQKVDQAKSELLDDVKDSKAKVDVLVDEATSILRQVDSLFQNMRVSLDSMFCQSSAYTFILRVTEEIISILSLAMACRVAPKARNLICLTYFTAHGYGTSMITHIHTVINFFLSIPKMISTAAETVSKMGEMTKEEELEHLTNVRDKLADDEERRIFDGIAHLNDYRYVPTMESYRENKNRRAILKYRSNAQKDVLEKQKREYEENTKVFSQSNDEIETENFFQSLYHILCSVFKVQDKHGMKVTEIRSKFVNSVVGTGKNVQWLLTVIYEMIVYMIKNIFDIPSQDEKLVENFVNEIAVWMDNVNKQLPEDVQKKVDSDHQYALLLKRLYTQGMDIRTRMTEANINVAHQAFISFNATLACFERAYDAVTNKLRQDNGRVRPLGLLVYGAPGTGKTNLVKILTSDLLNAFYPTIEFNVNEHIYSRNVRKDFWDAYRGQFCCLYDDAFQIDDPEIRTRVGAEFIDVLNDNSLPLNMAELSEKKGTYFTSEMVVSVQNSKFIPPNVQLLDLRALERRFDYVIRVAVKKEFAYTDRHRKGQLDPQAVQRLCGTTWSRAPYDITLYDKFTQERIDHCSIEEVLRRCTALMTERKSNGANSAYFFQKNDNRSEDLRKCSIGAQRPIVTKCVDFSLIPASVRKKKQTELENELLEDQLETENLQEEAQLLSNGRDLPSKYNQFKDDFVLQSCETDDEMDYIFELLKRGKEVTLATLQAKRSHNRLMSKVNSPKTRDEFIKEAKQSRLLDAVIDRKVKLLSDYPPDQVPKFDVWDNQFDETRMNFEQAPRPRNLEEKKTFVQYHMTDSKLVNYKEVKTVWEEVYRKDSKEKFPAEYYIPEYKTIPIEDRSTEDELKTLFQGGFMSEQRYKDILKYYQAPKVDNEQKLFERMPFGPHANCNPNDCILCQKITKTHVDSLEDALAGVVKIPFDFVPDNQRLQQCQQACGRALWKLKFIPNGPQVVAASKALFAQMAENCKSQVSDFKHYLTEIYNKAKAEPFWTAGTAIVGVLAMCAAGYGLFTLYNKPLTEAHYGSTSGDEVTRSATQQKSSLIKIGKGQTLPLNQAFAQMSCADANTAQFVENVLRKNICRIRWSNGVDAHKEKGSKSSGYVHCTFVKERTALTVHHFFSRKPVGCDYILIEPSLDYNKYYFIHMDNINLTRLGEDLARIDILDRRVPLFPTIVDHFARENDLITGDLTHVGIVAPSGDVPIIWTGSAKKTTLSTYSDKFTDSEIMIENSLQVDIPGQFGWCGLPYVVFNTRFPKKLVGIHTAGSEYMSICRMISDDSIPYLTPVESQMSNESPKTVRVSGQLKEIGRVTDRREIPHPPSKTQILPSPLQSKKLWDTPKTAPCLLRPQKNPDGTWIVPTNNAIDRIGAKEILSPEKELEIGPELDAIAIAVAEQLLPKPTIAPRELTMEECLNGIPGSKHTRAIDMTTSVGYLPELQKSGITGKRQVVVNRTGDPLNPIYELSPNYAKLVEEYDKHIRAGLPFRVFWKNCLKDERKKIETVLKGKTRLFSAGEFRHLILRRKYFQCFVDAMMSDPVNSPIAVGINVHSPQWHLLYKRLNAWLITHFFEGDYNQYDTTIAKILKDAALKCIDRWYAIHYPNESEESKQARRVLNENTYKDGIHILVDLLYKMPEGNNPSGDLLTTIFNCICNIIISIWCVIRTARQKKITNEQGQPFGFQDYLKHFRLSTFGDDKGETTHVDWYTLEDNIHWLKEVGMRLTPAEKTAEWKQYRYKGEEISFLKRKFIQRNGITFAPLPIDVIRETPLWVRDNGIDPYENMAQSAEASIREMFHHGRQAYDAYHLELQSACLRAGCRPLRVEPFDRLMAQYLGDGFDTNVETPMIPEIPDYNMTMKLSAQSDNGKAQVFKKYKAKCLNTRKYVIKKRKDCEPTVISEQEMNMLVYNPKTKYFDHVTVVVSIDGNEPSKMKISKLEPQMSESSQQNPAQPGDTVTPITSVDQLTAFKDTHVVSDDAPAMTTMYGPTNPYKEQNLDVVLTRAFKVDDFSWSSTDAFGATIYTGKFPELLWAQTMISDMIKMFQFFRAGVHVAIRISATPFHFGQLLVVHESALDLSLTAPNSRTHFQNIYQLSNCNCLIASATNQTTVEFDIPYSWLAEWLKIDTSLSGSPAMIGSFRVLVLAPLGLAGVATATTVACTIHANFIKPQVAGMCFPISVGKNPIVVRGKKKPNNNNAGKHEGELHAQMSEVKKERDSKVDKGRISTGLKAVSKAAGWFKPLPIVGDIAGKIEFGSGLLGKVAEGLGFTRTTSDEIYRAVVPRTHSNMAISDDVDNAIILALNNDAKVGTNFSDLDQEDYDNLANLVSIPMMFSHISFDGSTSENTSIVNFICCPALIAYRDEGTFSYYYPSHAAQIAKLHTFWRGSLKYMLKFCTSNFVTCKVLIVWTPNNPPATMSANASGYVINQVVDVTGDTTVTFTVPYLAEFDWLRTPQANNVNNVDHDNIGYITVYMMNPPVSNGTVADTTVHLNIWGAGGPDLMFSRPTDPKFSHSGCTVLEAQMGKVEGRIPVQNPRAAFKCEFEGLVGPVTSSVQKELVMSDVTARVTQIMSRYHMLWNNVVSSAGTDTAQVLVWQFATGNSITGNATLIIFSRMFHKYRGSLKFLVVPHSSVAQTGFQVLKCYRDGRENAVTTSSGLALNLGVQSLVHDIKIPYYSKQKWVGYVLDGTYLNGSYESFTYITQMNFALTDTTEIYLAAGDDFMVGQPLPPLNYI